MSKKAQSIRSQRGSALISALALVAMSSLLLSGVAILASSHAERQRREADYALAMQMAEAGVNYEMRYLTSTSSTGHTSASPYSGTVAALPTSQQAISKFSVYTDTANKKIYSTGTVGDIASTTTVNEGVTRCVVLDYDSSIFDGAYAMFATKSVTASSNTVTGKVGCNTTAITGCKSTTTQCPSRTDSYPTVNEVCTKTFGTAGWSALTSASAVSAQCSRMRCYTSSYWGFSGDGVTPSTTTSCNWSHSSGTPTCTDSQIGALPANTLILPPGDYYFKNADCLAYSGNKIICDNAAHSTGGTPGVVRIWVGCQSDSTTDSTDSLDIDMDCTSTDASIAPRIYYGRCTNSSDVACTFSCGGRTRNMSHSTSCNRGLYAVCQGKDGTGKCPTLKLMSSCKLKGNCIGDKIAINQSTTTAQSQNMKNSNDPARPNSVVIGRWQEVKAPGASKVFSDGTDY